MDQVKRHQFIVYLPTDLAQFVRSGATAHGDNISAYFRSLIEREAVGESRRRDGERRILEYLLTIGFRQLEIAGPEHLKAAQTIHSQRMAQGKSYAD